MTESDLYSGIVALCQGFGFTTEETYEKVDELIATILPDDEECGGECVTRPHRWSPSGARCTRTGCKVAGTGDPCNDGDCEGED